MRTTFIALALLALSVGIMQSCTKEPLQSTTNSTGQSSNLIAGNALSGTQKLSTAKEKILSKAAAILKADNLQSELLKKLAQLRATKNVAASTCSSTTFYNLIDRYLSKFGEAEYELYGLYTAINYLYNYIDNSNQYFGASGENTHLVTKEKRNLESFWDMPFNVQLKGEHNSTLNNRDKIAKVYIEFAGATKEEAYSYADELIAFNKQSPVFVETPLLSFDAFSDPGRMIVLGDGIIQVLSEAGVDDKIVVPGVLSHEWAHQLQFINSKDWFGVSVNEWPFTSEFTRLTELEADCFAGYYLTHKRGGTYNWKRVAQFFTLFYNIGDCYFDDPSHHGTPNERLAAARLGYIIADETFPKGHILSADAINSIYMASFNSIINTTISTQQALAKLKGAELKAIYKNLLKYKAQIKAIANGSMSQANIENL